ncbi:hypothetical protein VTP01DRAFT_2883 [Rhizomucor pusillus]|uniref:uncharacterized protein n=1 Tax=Rhizomucor pusillus TaxID=4840 RepID=UPI0037449275
MATQSLSPPPPSQLQLTDESANLGKHKALMLLQPTKKSQVTTVILKPRNIPFQTKTLELHDNVHVKVGRQTSSKTQPGPFNGYFDSKVLSRTHAEIWSEHGKVYIKDIKSSNGTFLNGRRLSNENEESKPTEIRSNDEIEFGIDISQDDGSILYHKVACQVHIIPTPLSQVDSAVLKELCIGIPNGNNNEAHHSLHRKTSSSSISTISSVHSSASVAVDLSSSPGAISGRRSNKNLDLLVNRLQSELQKSQEVEGQLKAVKEAISDVSTTINDTLLGQANARNAALQRKLQEAEAQVKSYAEKSRQQDRAIASASKELLSLRNTIRQLERGSGVTTKPADKEEEEKSKANALRELQEIQLTLEAEKIKLEKQLLEKQSRSLKYEAECIELRRRVIELEEEARKLRILNNNTLADLFQHRMFQTVIAVLLAIISALLYVIFAL